MSRPTIRHRRSARSVRSPRRRPGRHRPRPVTQPGRRRAARSPARPHRHSARRMRRASSWCPSPPTRSTPRPSRSSRARPSSSWPPTSATPRSSSSSVSRPTSTPTRATASRKRRTSRPNRPAPSSRYTFNGDGPFAYGDQLPGHYAAGAKGDIVLVDALTPAAAPVLGTADAPRIVVVSIAADKIDPATVEVVKGETIKFLGTNVSDAEVELIVGLKTDVDADAGDSLKEAENIATESTGTIDPLHVQWRRPLRLRRPAPRSLRSGRQGRHRPRRRAHAVAAPDSTTER